MKESSLLYVNILCTNRIGPFFAPTPRASELESGTPRTYSYAYIHTHITCSHIHDNWAPISLFPHIYIYTDIEASRETAMELTTSTRQMAVAPSSSSTIPKTHTHTRRQPRIAPSLLLLTLLLPAAMGTFSQGERIKRGTC